MDWARDGAIWPNRAASRFVDLRPHRWHVQVSGAGADLLLLHGAGGATQSWRGLLPLLAEHVRVIAPDLPGQGFTRMGTRGRSGLRATAEDLAALCASEGWAPRAIVGHSAGAALALELADRLRPERIVGINAALGKFEGIAGWLFPLMAKMMALNPMIPPLLARMSGGPERARELLATTGSEIDEAGIALYRRLMADRGHIDGTLTMMAQWNIDGLLERLPAIRVPTLLLVGEADGTVPPKVSFRAAESLPDARVVAMPGLGHLMHEEAPERVAEAIVGFLHAPAEASRATG